MRIKQVLAAAMIIAIPVVALADTDGASQQLPEPESLALFGIAAAALFIARWRNKR